jgi:hypothetical protein
LQKGHEEPPIHLRSRCKVEKIPPERILDLDNPEVRIEADLAFQARFGGRGVNPFVAMKPREKPVIAFDFALGGGAEERAAAIEAIDFDQDGAGLGSPPPSQDRHHTLDATAAQIGRNPKITAQPHV